MKNTISAAGDNGSCFQNLFDKTSDAAFVVDVHARVVLGCNQTAERVFGFTAEELIGHSTQRLHVDAEAFQRFEDVYRRAFQHGGVYATRYNVRCRNGSVYPARVRLIPIDTSDYADLVLSLVHVETEPALHVSSLEHELVRLATSAEPIDNRWAAVIERLAAEIDWEYGELWSFHAGHLTLGVQWSLDELSPEVLETRRATHFKLGEGLPGRVYRTLQPQWVSDAPVVSMPFRSWFAFPVRHNGRVDDVLTFASRAERECDERVINLTQHAVESIVHLLVKANVIEIDSATQRNFANLCRLHPLPIWVCDVCRLRIFDANEAAIALTGYEETELKSRTFTELIDSAGADDLIRHLPSPDRKAQQIGNVSVAKKDGTFVDLYLQMFTVDWYSHETFAILGIKSVELAPWLVDVQSDVPPLEERLQALTRREKQVLDFVMEGKSNHETSHSLDLSPRTVEVYRASMMRKMGARSATHLLSMLTFNREI